MEQWVGGTLDNCHCVGFRTLGNDIMSRRIATQPSTLTYSVIMVSYRTRNAYYSGASDKGPSEIGQPPNKGHSSGLHSHSSSSFLTSEKRTTSQQRTKWLVPKCPLFGGSTVYIRVVYNLHPTCLYDVLRLFLQWKQSLQLSPPDTLRKMKYIIHNGRDIIIVSGIMYI